MISQLLVWAWSAGLYPSIDMLQVTLELFNEQFVRHYFAFLHFLGFNLPVQIFSFEFQPRHRHENIVDQSFVTATQIL